MAKRIAAQRNLPLAGPRTVDLPPLSIRAVVMPASVNEEDRTVDLTWTTGAAVERMDWMSGERFLETLSLDPAHVRLDRLNSGGPLLDSHSAWSVSDQLGAVVPGSVTLNKKEGRATVRFSRREAVEGIWQDVQDGLISSVSVGYRVHRFEETAGKGNKLPIRKAIDWEPFEVSMVPMPADPGAKVRDGHSEDMNRCEIVPAEAPAQGAPVTTTETVKTEERTMEDNGLPGTIVEDNPLATPPAKPAAPPVPSEGDVARAAERTRTQGILLACRAAKLPQSHADKLIADGTDLTRAQTMIFEELARRGGDSSGPGRIPSGSDAAVGDDPLVHKLDGVRNALLHRAASELRDKDNKPCFPLSDQGREYRGMSLLDIARGILNSRGVRTSSMSKMDLAAAALGLDTRAGMHTTSDFALLLADVQGKVLRAAYGEAPQTWQPLARRVVLPDFKASKQLQFGEAPELLEVLEHGEFTRGTIGESREQFSLKTWGRVFAITRQALINDDLDAFSRVPTEFGRSARRKESDLAWLQITANAAMGDAVALFHATHANLSGTSDAISIASIGAARKALRIQTGVDGESILNLMPRFLIVPAALETIAQQFVSQIFAAQSSNVNPFVGQLQVIAEPRLDANSATAWYLAASIDQGADVLLHGVLEGQEGPTIDTRVGFDIDGIEIKCRLDVNFKTGDWRGIFKNPGA